MSAAHNNLLDAALAVAGVQAAAIIELNRHALARSNVAELSETELAPVWRHVADTMEVSAHHRLSALQMRWIFDGALVYCLRRGDGRLLAVIATRESDRPFDTQAAEQLFDEFRQLRSA